MTNGNPNHPVVLQMEHEWHKIAAMLMLRIGIDEFQITVRELQRLEQARVSIVADARGGKFVIRLLPEVEAETLARQEGGLPQ